MPDDDSMHALPMPLIATVELPGEPPPADLRVPLKPTGFHAAGEGAESAATDTVTDLHGTPSADVSNDRQTVVQTADADAAITFKTHHSDLSVLAEILLILAPVPVPTDTVKAAPQERRLKCTVGPDGLRVELGTSSQPCHVHVSLVPGLTPEQPISFLVSPWALRVAARQPPKGTTRRKMPQGGSQRLAGRLLPRVRSPALVDNEPITWTIASTGECRLSVASLKLSFDAELLLREQQPTPQAPGSEKMVAPEKIRRALLACRPATSTDGKLPERCVVDIKDGVARAGDGRWFAHHRDNALSELDVAVDRADIGTLQALLDRLDRTATTLRAEGELLLFTDNRLTVGFQPPKKRALTWDSVESWPPTLAFECSTEALKKLLTFAGTLISSKNEEKRDLQIRFFLELKDGDIVLRARATWHRFNLDESSIAITMSIEQANAVRERLGHGSRGTLDAKTNIDAESGTLEATTLPIPKIVEEAERTAEPATATPATIELGRYAYAELAKAIMLMRSGLTRLGFKEHPTAGATVIIVTDVAVDHTSTYAIPAWAENTTPGLKKRRQQRSYW